MNQIRTALLSLCVYRELTEIPPLCHLKDFYQSDAPDDRLAAYARLVGSVLESGYDTLSDSVRSQLLYRDSSFGRAAAAGTEAAVWRAAAARDINLLSTVVSVPFAQLKAELEAGFPPEIAEMLSALPELPQGKPILPEEILDFYRTHGCGLLAQGQAFHWQKGKLSRILHPDPLCEEEMIGYTQQRQQVIENTRFLVSGKRANNVLLYGDSGTGKSATVKALIHIPEFASLRLIEVAKDSLDELPSLIHHVGQQPQRFILYIDDLSFEKGDKGYSAMKTALEGGVEQWPENTVIYATSNRRHMIQENFSDRGSDDVHAKETLEEQTSLAERFGLRIAFLSLDKRRYTNLVLELCRRRGLHFEESFIRTEANKWEIRCGARTPRTAVQLVEHLSGKEYAENQSTPDLFPAGSKK